MMLTSTFGPLSPSARTPRSPPMRFSGKIPSGPASPIRPAPRAIGNSVGRLTMPPRANGITWPRSNALPCAALPPPDTVTPPPPIDAAIAPTMSPTNPPEPSSPNAALKMGPRISARAPSRIRSSISPCARSLALAARHQIVLEARLRAEPELGKDVGPFLDRLVQVLGGAKCGIDVLLIIHIGIA